MTIEHSPRWQELHDVLKSSMQKEVGLMREVLANMHQEEISLLALDKSSWNHIMQERYSLMQKLSGLRLSRLKATKELEHMASPHGNPLSLEQILPPSDEGSCEILYLLDQIMALIEKMNHQNCLNESLFKQYQHRLNFPNHFQSSSLKSIQPVHKNKASVATYPQKRP